MVSFEIYSTNQLTWFDLDSRLSWDFQAYLKQILQTIRTVISYITRKTTFRIDQVVWIYNVVETFIQNMLYDTFEKYKNKDPTMQQTSMLCVMNPELRDTIFAKLPFNEIFRLQIVCKAFDNVMESENFKSLRKTSEGLFGPNVFYLEITTNMHMIWKWISYDIISQQWKKMPPFSSLPLPDVELFKDFFVAGGHGLVCVDVGKGSTEELILYQPLTKRKKVLPHLIHRRRPVLIHVIVDEVKNIYKIIVAGSSTIGTKHLSRKTEVYNSHTSCWSESDDIPGPDFALNEYQTGVYVKALDVLFCIGFLPRDKGRGILTYNVAKKMWIKDAYYQLPNNFLFNEMRVSTHITIAQLVEYDNDVFLFSEQGAGQEVTHSIHKLQRFENIEIVNNDENDYGKVTDTWKKVLCESRNGTRGLLVYPEFECIAHGKNQFCIFNTIEHSGTLYTIHCKNGIHTTSKQKLPQFPKLNENSLIFHSLNSLGFAFELSFKISL